MERLSRPKTVNQAAFQFGTDLVARNTLQQHGGDSKISLPPIGLGSRMSADWEGGGGGGGQWGTRRGVPGGMVARSVEIQTEQPNHAYGEYQDTFETIGYRQQVADDSDWQTFQLPGYHGLPVMQPQRAMNPFGRTVTTGRGPASAVALPGHPFYRSGRNGSNWRHVTQCTGNLGNHIVFINGHVKSEDCERFPPNGYPAGTFDAGTARQHLPIASAFPPARNAAGNRSSGGLLSSKALQRAKAGNKYWFEDKRPPTLVPNTIQGRIMKSGVAY